MSAERLFQVLGLVDSSLIEEASPEKRPISQRRVRQAWRGAAASLTAACLILALGLGWFATGGFRGFGAGSSSGSGAGNADSGGAYDGGPSADPGEPASGENGSGVEDAAVFMSYAGPVLPLTTLEASELTAERKVTWDFASGSYADGEPRQWGAGVTDAYLLSNPSEEEAVITALYPFAGNLLDLETLRPTVSVNGAETETSLYAGAYSGGFQSTFGASIPDTMNLASLNSWTEYKALLESGAYQTQALADKPVLNIPVTVYEFSGFAAPHDAYPAATQAVSFAFDESAAKIFTYGFNGFEQGEGFRRYSYFVPDGMRRESNVKILAVLGEDVGEYSLQGYQNGGCNAGEEIEGVRCTVTRSVTTLDRLLDRLCRAYAEDWEGVFETLSQEMYQGAVAELLTQYGLLSGAPVDRYDNGRLDDLLAETLSQDRVFYLAFPVTVPAGGSVRLECQFWKEPSYDFQCSGSENVGLQGYDLMTRLGSSLSFTRQSAAFVNLDGVDVVFPKLDLQPNQESFSTELNPEAEHFFLEIRPKEKTEPS